MKRSFLTSLCKYHIFSALCGAMILVLCMVRIPQQDSQIAIPYFDKIVHFCMYFAFSLIYIMEHFRANTERLKKPFLSYLYAMILSLAIGGIIEIFQADFTDYRSGEFIDWVSDFSGCIFGILTAEFVRRASLRHGR